MRKGTTNAAANALGRRLEELQLDSAWDHCLRPHAGRASSRAPERVADLVSPPAQLAWFALVSQLMIMKWDKEPCVKSTVACQDSIEIALKFNSPKKLENFDHTVGRRGARPAAYNDWTEHSQDRKLRR